MKNKFKLLTSIMTLVLANNCVCAYVTKTFAAQRKLFIQVEKDLKNGKTESFKKNKHALLHYPLYPYLRYELLRKNINTLKYNELKSFITSYSDSPLAGKLRNEWLKSKAENKQYQDFLQAYVPTIDADNEFKCHYITAELQVNNNKDVYKYVPKIWLTNKSLPKSCDIVLENWKQEGLLTKSLIWQRIKLSINDGNKSLARFLAKDLSENEKKLVELWIRTHEDPNIISKNHYFTSKHPAVIEIVIHGMKKIAKLNPNTAISLWKKLEKRHKFTEQHWGEIVKELGLSLARKLDKNAIKWLDVLPSHLVTNDIYDAKLKVAIKYNDWGLISKVYQTLPETQKRSDKWIYWYARALEMQNKREASQALLAELSQLRNYYGFLASSRILKPFAFNHQSSNIPREVVDAVLQKPGIIRAFELRQLEKTNLGRLEWQKAIDEMTDTQRLACAHLAAKWQIPNWAITALANSIHKNDLALRFPKTYSDLIHKEARINSLDPELLFAITRQESAFIPTAKSPVGALGLMQIMPSTGKMIARINKEKFVSKNELLKPDKNIRYGSKYVRMMLDKHNQNTALAAAAYNAGPHRVTNWLPDYDMPTDSWIETIPFRETREYVQNVLTYTIIYQQLLGKSPKLSNHMPIIAGNKRK